MLEAPDRLPIPIGSLSWDSLIINMLIFSCQTRVLMKMILKCTTYMRQTELWIFFIAREYEDDDLVRLESYS